MLAENVPSWSERQSSHAGCLREGWGCLQVVSPMTKCEVLYFVSSFVPGARKDPADNPSR
jgi:hypothetical protein